MRLISLQLVLHPPILASYSDFSFLGEKAGGIALQQNIRTSIVTTSVPICLTLFDSTQGLRTKTHGRYG